MPAKSAATPRTSQMCSRTATGFLLETNIWQFLHCFPHLPKLEITGRASRSCARARLRAREQVPGALVIGWAMMGIKYGFEPYKQ